MACCSLRKITRVLGECFSMGVQLIQFCRFTIGRTYACIDTLHKSRTRQPQHIPEHHSPVMASRVLSCDETVNSLSNVALIQSKLSMSHSLAFDAQIGFSSPN